MMKIAITGATGLIGTGLVQLLAKEGNDIIALSRYPEAATAKLGGTARVLKWDSSFLLELATQLEGTEAIVNLAGENIASGLWTLKKRRLILESRINSGSQIVKLVKLMQTPPTTIVQASAVGYYGSRGDEILTEDSPPGSGFLADVVQKWERSTLELSTRGIRTVAIRTGVVLSMIGGALPKIVLPFSFYAGTLPGSGSQWVPWIHYEDEIRAISFLLKNKNISGAINLTAPHPATMAEILRTISLILHRPIPFKIPNLILKLILGKMAEETILTSQRVVPGRLTSSGFEFQYPDVAPALKNLLVQ